MVAKMEFSLLILLTFSLFLACQCYPYPTPSMIELQKCQMRCLEKEEDHGSRHQTLCLMECHGRYGNAEEIDQNQQREDPKTQYESCQRGCELRYQGERQGQQRQYCQEKCKEQFQEQKGQQQGGGSREGEEQTGEKENNPYFFEGQRFKSRFSSEAGNLKILERFTKRSELLKGIDNYRLAIFEADPNTFLLPHHCDGDAVFYVSRGEGTISFVHHKRRESFNLERGDAIKVPAGSTVYLINRHNNEKLKIFMFIHPINIPGRIEAFFGVGGREQAGSFYRVFSNEILEAALNTPRDKLERVFGQQRHGVIVRASQEQIRALSQDGEEGSSKKHKEKSRGPFNLLNQKPAFCNNHGQFFLASPEDYKQLRDLDVSVAVMNITQGAMVVPNYNSRSTILVLVDQGSGYFELACPHLASQSQQGPGGTQEQEQEQEQERRGIQYQKASAQFSVGDVFIIPADHPISIVSTGNQDLVMVGFGIKAENNHKYFLAGQNNIWNEVESEAKELSFNVPSKEVDEVLRSQKLSYFVPVSGRQQRGEGEGGRGNPLSSVLDFADFM